MPLFTNEDLDTNVNGAGAAAVNVQDGGNSLTVDGTITANIGTTNGLALDATLTGGTQKTKVVDTGGTNVLSVSAAGAAKVDGSAVTQPISAASLPLPTGAATEATLSTRLADATFTARINTLGQKTSANSTPIVIASDQSAIPVTVGGTGTATVTRVSVDNTVAVTLSASNSAKQRVVIYNEGGTLFVKFGATASSTSFTYTMTANATLEIEGYFGIITARKSAGTTFVDVTEVGI